MVPYPVLARAHCEPDVRLTRTPGPSCAAAIALRAATFGSGSRSTGLVTVPGWDGENGRYIKEYVVVVNGMHA